MILAGSNNAVGTAGFLDYDHFVIKPLDNDISAGFIGDEKMIVRLKVRMYVIGFEEFQSLLNGCTFVENSSNGAKDNEIRLALILMCLIDSQFKDPCAYALLIHSVYNKIRRNDRIESSLQRIRLYLISLPDTENAKISQAYGFICSFRM